MLTIKTKLAQSKIAGIGLFANEFIPKGSLVWKFVPGFDLLLAKEDVSRLSPAAQEQVHRYAFLEKKYKKYILCGDDARFFNHSKEPNCDDSTPDITTALRDINPGEELTVDYEVFYDDIADHPEIQSLSKTH